MILVGMQNREWRSKMNRILRTMQWSALVLSLTILAAVYGLIVSGSTLS